jgi:nicotinamidase-related amidase
MMVDMQERILSAAAGGDMVVFNACRLIEAANEFSIPVFVTEQYPEKLGETVPAIAKLLIAGTRCFTKRAFSICSIGELCELVEERVEPKVVICGVELHVCVLQSAFDLMAIGKEVIVVTDACACRFQNDYDIALRRLESAGATLTTTEMTMFEWCETSDTAAFKKISKLAKERLN